MQLSLSVTYEDMNSATPRLAYRVPKRRFKPRRKRFTADPVEKMRKRVAGIRSSILRRMDAIKFRFGKPAQLMKKRQEIAKLKTQYDMLKRQLARMLQSREKMQSTSAAKPDIKAYDWFTFTGKRVFKILDGHRTYDLELETGGKFGLKLGRVYTYLVSEDDTSLVFKLKSETVARLLKNSKGYSGKIGRITVQAGRALGDKPKTKPTPSATQSDTLVKQSKGKENKLLTKRLKALPVEGIEGIKFIMAQEVLPGEVYHYYDVATLVEAYQLKYKLGPTQVGHWAQDIERQIESKDKTIDVQLGTVATGTRGSRHVMSVIEE